MRKHISITIKTFVLILISFIVILVLTYKQSFDMYKNYYLSYSFKSNEISKIQELYKPTLSLKQNAELNNYIKKYVNTDFGFTAILDKNLNIITINEQNQDPNLIVIAKSNNAISDNIVINQTIAEKINHYLDEHTNNDYTIYVDGEMSDHSDEYLEENKDEIAQSSTINPTYLKINDNVIIDGYHDDIKEYKFYWYSSLDYVVMDSEISESGLFEVIHTKEVIENAKTLITDSTFKSYQQDSYSETGTSYKDVDEGTYYYTIGVLRDENYTEEHINGDIAGYYLDVGFVPRLNYIVLKTYIENNYYVYILSIIFIGAIAMIVSRTITRPIRRFASVTNEIANGHFDEILKEKSNDEVGALADNINTMSTNLKITIDRLNKEIERVKSLESVRKEFIANFTHEIKTPLGIINGYCELLEDASDEKTRENYISIINEQTDRINRLVLAMLDLNRLESGKVELHKADMNLEESMTYMLDILDLKIKEKNIHIVLDTDDVVICADHFLIEMVLKNYMSNAIKHTLEGGTITIRIKEHFFEIENEGEQISEKDMPYIFETFVSSDRGGTGLGLAICKTILSLHDYHYGVRNSENGVVFYFEY